MDREQILEAFANLPDVKYENRSERKGYLRGVESGANYQLAKAIVRNQEGQSVLLLTLSTFGPNRSKQLLIADFVDALGEPLTRNTVPGPNGIPVDVVTWQGTPNLRFYPTTPTRL